jgi:hypothetical protein
MFFGQGIKDIGNFMVPAALLGDLRILLAQCRPQSQVPIGYRASPGLEAPLA